MSLWELMVVLLVAVLVIKPERLPEVSYTLGRWVARFRHWYSNTFQPFSSNKE